MELPDLQPFDRFKIFRKSHKLSQSELGELLNVQQATVSRYELGASEIPIWVMQKLMETYGLSANWLIAGHGNMLIIGDGELPYQSTITIAPKSWTSGHSGGSGSGGEESREGVESRLAKTEEELSKVREILAKQQELLEKLGAEEAKKK